MIYSIFILVFVIGTAASIRAPWKSFSKPADYDYNSLTPDDELPRILTKGGITVARKGENVTLKCDVAKLGNYNVIWQKGGTILWILQGSDDVNPQVQFVTNDDRIGRNGTSLYIQNVSPEDEADYTCEVSPNQNEYIGHRLTVLEPPSAEPFDEVDFVQGNEKETVELKCEVSGSPSPRVTWERLDNKTMHGLSYNASLTIYNVTSSDAGSYACVAKNGVGEPAKALITLNVFYAPRVIPSEEKVHSGVGYDAHLWCYVDASPFPRVDWYKKGSPVNPMRIHKGIEKGNMFFLYFEQIYEEDFGLYYCNATNILGSNCAVVKLTGKPKKPFISSGNMRLIKGNYTLTWEVESYSPIISYFLYLKNQSSMSDNEEWTNITVPGHPSSSMYHSQRYVFTGFSDSSKLLAKVVAVNEFGSSKFSRLFEIYESGEAEEVFENNDEPYLAGGRPVLDSEHDRNKPHKGRERGRWPPDGKDGLVIKEDESNPGNDTKNKSMDTEDSDVSSDGAPTPTPSERRTQMVSIVTAISLSCFFSYFAMRL